MSSILDPAERRKAQWVGFDNTQTKCCRQMQTEQVPTVWSMCASWPAGSFKQLDDPQVLGHTVAVNRIEDEHVEISPQSTIGDQVASLRRRKQCFARCDRWRVRTLQCLLIVRTALACSQS